MPNSFLSQLSGSIWAMEPNRLEAHILAVTGIDVPVDMIEAVAAARARAEEVPDYVLSGSTAIIPISGIILKTIPWIYEWFGISATSTLAIRQTLDQAIGNDQVKDIMLAIDSPGGTIEGVQDLADAIFAARSVKPIRAHIDDLGASAAYWLASQADAISANRTAEIGSIGVYAVYTDYSEMAKAEGIKVYVVRSDPLKGAGVPGDKITPAQLEAVQEIVDGLRDEFVSDIARGRGVEAKKIRRNAKGRTWLAEEARSMGLIDEVANFETALANVRSADLEKEKAMADTTKTAPEVNAEEIRAEAAKEAQKEAVSRLKALQAAFQTDAAFAQSEWEAGHDVAQAQIAHYPLVLEQLNKASEQIDKLKVELLGVQEELQTFKDGLKKTGTAPIRIEDTPVEGQGAIEVYEKQIAVLVEKGITNPEQVLVEKYPAMHRAWLDAVNAGPKAEDS